MKKHILVTGGAGFIGSNLTNALLPNYKVTCIDNLDDFYSIEHKEYNLKPLLLEPDFSFINGDIRNYADLEKVEKVDIIVHLAAKAGVLPSLLQPAFYQDVNVNGTQTLLEFAKNQNIKQFIFASSSSVYGVNENVPWNEEEKLLPISPYAATKLSAEMLGHVYSKLYGIRFLALRFFTVYGPGQRPDLAIHKFFKLIMNGMPISVYGDGSTSRDYTFVDDTVQGIVSAIEYNKTDFEIINIGNNDRVILSDLIAKIENICNKNAIINRLPNQMGDVPCTYADIQKSQSLLDYNPSTKIEEGLQKFYNWHRSFNHYIESKNHTIVTAV